MVIVKLRCDKKVNQKLRTYNIDRRKLENLLMFLTNNIVNKRKTYYYEIKVKGISGASSQYFWEEDEIEVALNAADCKSTKQRSIYFVQGLVHEYRHWVQSQLQNVSSKRLNYSEKDIEEGNDNYKKNKYELECIEWEDLVEKYIDQLKK
tara:strand:+ start:2024 stop:2473 length:450 start_codon:yes stop_codon:yes gene_type:complete